jgi:hypothetical protein
MARDFSSRTSSLPAGIPVPRRDGERGAAAPHRQVPPALGYLQALRLAYDLGWADGRLAADLGLGEPPDPTGPVCRGRDAGGFAQSLWGAGPVPSGLEVNAPLWYAAGMADALDDALDGA